MNTRNDGFGGEAKAGNDANACLALEAEHAPELAAKLRVAVEPRNVQQACAPEKPYTCAYSQQRKPKRNEVDGGERIYLEEGPIVGFNLEERRRGLVQELCSLWAAAVAHGPKCAGWTIIP